MISEYECFATKNFCTFFATPDQDVLHYASGFYRPAMFLKELDFVLELKGAVLDLRNRFMEDACPEFQDVHQQHVRSHRREEERLKEADPPRKRKGERPPSSQAPGADRTRSGNDESRRFDRRDQESRKHHIVGLRHLSDVHRDLVSKSWFQEGPVPLSKVFKDYLFGNPFQESGDRGKKELPPRDRGPGMKG
jgi:hypothetical protein